MTGFEMEKQVKDYIRLHDMIKKGEHILVGVSGGADSVCLLRIFVSLRQEWNITVTAVHINHGIRGPEADEDEKFVQKLCSDWEIPCLSFACDVPALAQKKGMSLEEAGRYVRYQIFEQQIRMVGANKVAVAHHRDDNEETILLHLFRGSGLKGLRGIEPVRGNIIRPLLCLTRKELEAYLEEKGILWRVDSTNLSEDYMRNKIRLNILPYLKNEVEPAIGRHFVNSGLIFGEIDEYLTNTAVAFLEENALITEEEFVFPLEKLKSTPIAILRYVLQLSLERLAKSRKDISFVHIENMVQLLNKRVGKTVDLPYKIQAEIGYDSFTIRKRKEKCELITEYKMVTTIFPNKKEKIPKNGYTNWFDYDKIKGTIQLRTRKQGDTLQVLQSGGSKKLKDYMIDAKIPREIRDQIPVVAVENDILWVVGYRMSEAYKVTDKTNTILQIEIRKEETNDGYKD